jgi:hypothetical protein
MDAPLGARRISGARPASASTTGTNGGAGPANTPSPASRRHLNSWFGCTRPPLGSRSRCPSARSGWRDRKLGRVVVDAQTDPAAVTRNRNRVLATTAAAQA